MRWRDALPAASRGHGSHCQLSASVTDRAAWLEAPTSRRSARLDALLVPATVCMGRSHSGAPPCYPRALTSTSTPLTSLVVACFVYLVAMYPLPADPNHAIAGRQRTNVAERERRRESVVETYVHAPTPQAVGSSPSIRTTHARMPRLSAQPTACTRFFHARRKNFKNSPTFAMRSFEAAADITIFVRSRQRYSRERTKIVMSAASSFEAARRECRDIFEILSPWLKKIVCRPLVKRLVEACERGAFRASTGSTLLPEE